MDSPASLHWFSSVTALKSRSVSGRLRSKFNSTMTSVPPLIHSANGCADLSFRASISEVGLKKSMSISYQAGHINPASGASSRLTTASIKP